MFTIYLDGGYKKVSEKTLKGLTPGKLKGLGVFETLLCRGGEVFFLREHLKRFAHGVDRYILPRPLDLGRTKVIIAELLKINRLKDARIRLLGWRKGSGTHLAVVAIPHHAFSREVYQRGFCACIYPKRLDRSFHLARVKSLEYGFFLKAYEYALKNNYCEAVFLNSGGQIVEASRSNIFFVKGKKLFTPPLSSGCLAGVTRQMVLSAAKNLGVKVSTAMITPASFQGADEAFLTNALVGIMPLTCLGGCKIGLGRLGPLTLRLDKSYKKLSRERGIFLV